jgi:hypothetical protein
MNRVFSRKCLLAFVLLMGSSLAAAAIESRPVHFAKGASSTTIKGSLKGDQTIDYKLGARAGQSMTVKLHTGNGSNYFNVLPPGSNDEAVFVGSSGGNEWTGALAADGNYTIRVYLMRNAARRGEKANFTLTVGISGSASKASVAPAADLGKAPASDAKVKGTPYNATGMIDCSMGDAKFASQCDFGVIRGKSGNAEVHIKPKGGLERVLTFMGEKVTSGSEKVKATHSGDEWTVEVNDYEHYRIFDAVIVGG